MITDIVSWLPHGRAWRVWKPREFEVKVIPTYFEHNKFSSFIRQANGWGFRRITTKGPDRNSYYHELFIRGVPHLTKQMKRPAPNEKPVADPSTEPNFYAIAEERPLPEVKGSDEPEISMKKPDLSPHNSEEALQAQLVAMQSNKPAATDLGELSFENMFFEPLPVEQGTTKPSFEHEVHQSSFSQPQPQQHQPQHPTGEVFHFGKHTFISDAPAAPVEREVKMPQYQPVQQQAPAPVHQHHQQQHHSCTCQCGNNLSNAQPDLRIGGPVHDPSLGGNLADEFDPLLIAQSADFWAL